jgi:hypothetical protein
MDALPSQDDFPSTHWSTVLRAGGWDSSGGREALDRLLTQYRRAMVVHLRLRFRLNDSDAEDLVHAFVVSKILEQNLLAKADASRGRFRNLLKTSLDHFVISEFRRRQIPIDSQAELPTDRPAGGDDAAPLMREWAVDVVRQATVAFERDCLARNRRDLWLVFESCILGPSLHATTPGPRDELVAQLGLDGPKALSNLLVTARRKFARLLMEVIAQYSRSPAEVHEELLDLRKVLSQSADRPSIERND